MALGFGAMSQPLARSLRCAGPAFRHSFVPSVLGFTALLGEEHGVHTHGLLTPACCILGNFFHCSSRGLLSMCVSSFLPSLMGRVD